MSDHRIKIPVIVKKLVVALDTEGSNNHVYGLAHRDPMLPECAVVPRRTNRQSIVEHRHDLKLSQALLNPDSVHFVARSLQHLQQDEVTDNHLILVLDRAKPANCQAADVSQVRNPHRTVDDDH